MVTITLMFGAPVLDDGAFLLGLALGWHAEEIYGYPMSTCTKRVVVVLNETKTPFDLEVVDLSKLGQKSSDYLQKQPFGQVPCLVDDDLILFESRAIARYIALKASSPLVPTEAHAAARFEQAVSTEAFNFDPYASGIAVQRVSIPRRGGKSDEARVAELAGAFADKLEGYERILSRTEYLAGDKLTIADLFHLPYGAMLAPQGFTFLEDANKYPNVARWWKTITSRPSWQAVKDGIQA